MVAMRGHFSILIAKRNFRIEAPVSNRLIGWCSGGKAGLETGAPIKRRSFRKLLSATVLIRAIPFAEMPVQRISRYTSM